MGLLILDRDGVINTDSDNYIRSLEDWQPIPGSIAAIAKFSRAGYDVTIATNQSGLGRGYFNLEHMQSIHNRLHQLVEQEGGRIAGIYYCPHLPDAGCNCRKPATGMLEQMERELKQSAENAIFVGDSLKDLQAAQAYGCRPVLVTTGKGMQTLRTLHSDKPGVERPMDIPVYADLSTACDAILGTNI